MLGRGLPAAYRAAIRRGGTFVADAALGTRWSGLVECVRTSGSRSGHPTPGSRTLSRSVSQATAPGSPARELQRRKLDGDGRMEALRVLKRRLSDVVYRAMLTDQNQSLSAVA
jgi:hypothetical protein